MKLAHARGIFLLLDECYVYLQYAGAPVSGGSFVEAKEHVIVLGSLSKTYAMTGWRAGFALGPKPIIAAMSKLQSQSTSSTAAIRAKGGHRRAERFPGMRGRDAGGLPQIARPHPGPD